MLLFHLEAVGIAPLDADVRRLRANALCLMADLLERTEDRYMVVSACVIEIATEILREPDLPCRANGTGPTNTSVRPEASQNLEVVLGMGLPRFGYCWRMHESD